MNRKGPIEIAYSADHFDQWRLSQAGGKIHYRKNGQPVFRFDTTEQYEKYLALNVHRSA